MKTNWNFNFGNKNSLLYDLNISKQIRYLYLIRRWYKFHDAIQDLHVDT